MADPTRRPTAMPMPDTDGSAAGHRNSGPQNPPTVSTSRQYAPAEAQPSVLRNAEQSPDPVPPASTAETMGRDMASAKPAMPRPNPGRTGTAGRETRPVPFRGGGFAPTPVRGVAFALFALLLVLAEVGTRAGVISSLTLPRPSAVLETLVQLWQSGNLWRHLLPSLHRLFVGASLGIVVGVSVGVMIGLFSYVRAGLVPLVAALFPIPKIALLPLFVIWFGIDEASKYALIAFGTFTPTVVATYGAVDNVDRSLIRMGQSFGLSWWSIVRKIVLPGAFPAILSGLRVSISIAIILLVAAEMLGAQYGIGSYILEAGSLYDLEKLFAGVTILSLMGLVVNFVIGLIEKRFLAWR
ncbi:ABC transporter permease [Haematobacter massiliensis]|uniref:ABC transporter permease n=2 Tax=Haematobacter massiliensis TaxID=195105 RepID=A0A086Y365_9RHOB|nr:ABC transporter permease [Haematobacter massiliensis]